MCVVCVQAATCCCTSLVACKNWRLHWKWMAQEAEARRCWPGLALGLGLAPELGLANELGLAPELKLALELELALKLGLALEPGRGWS